MESRQVWEIRGSAKMIYGRDYEEIEKISPFPEDGSYQGDENSSNDGKIPIVMHGRCDIHVQALVGNIGCGGFWGKGLGTTVEDGIRSAISGVRFNAKGYLRCLKEGREEDNRDKEVAERILYHKGNIEDLFKLVYFNYNKKEIELQLGKYSRLERVVRKD